jgi:hypothetical protein
VQEILSFLTNLSIIQYTYKNRKNRKKVTFFNKVSHDYIINEFINELKKPKLKECSMKKKIEPGEKDCFKLTLSLREFPFFMKFVKFHNIDEDTIFRVKGFNIDYKYIVT